jgi:alkylation response protein AidB-like acyl-CoA dehydrogenase
MNLNYTSQELEFREAVKAFLESHLPADIREKLLDGYRAVAEDSRRWQRSLHGRGWGAGPWPEEFGGRNWSLVQHYLFELE